MIVETATITAINDGWLVVSTRAMSACGGCSANGKCGQNLWARFFGADIATDLHIEYSPGQTEELHLGDLVEIGLEEQALLKTSLVSYGAPLAGLVAGAIFLAPYGEVAAAAAALAGLIGGGYAARHWLGRGPSAHALNPQLMRRLRPAVPGAQARFSP